jgi:hypothetical protein
LDVIAAQKCVALREFSAFGVAGHTKSGELT